MLMRIQPNDIANVLSSVINQGLISDQDTSVVCYDQDRIRARLKELSEMFPVKTLHAVAVKANPLLSLLKDLVDQGAGLECASLCEVRLALAAGCPPQRIIFDSPVKTHSDLAFALDQGVHINVDNLTELDRIQDAIHTDSHLVPKTLGLRINPQVGQGRIPSTSVAADFSKFGVPLGEYRSHIVTRFLQLPWLNTLHCHIGSQGCTLEQLTGAVGQLLDVAMEIESKAGEQRVTHLDIGGGLPAPYSQEQESLPTAEDYVKALKWDYPELFGKKYTLMTEFGRYIHANAAFAATRVEYVKIQEDQRLALVHLGADMFLRKCYQPDFWQHELCVFAPNGQEKSAPALAYNIGGPLCFAGDFLARNIRLPELEPGDWLGIRDAGAYTLSMWSRYNSRPMPLVLAYSTRDDELVLSPVKPRETFEQVLSFWS